MKNETMDELRKYFNDAGELTNRYKIRAIIAAVESLMKESKPDIEYVLFPLSKNVYDRIESYYSLIKSIKYPFHIFLYMMMQYSISIVDILIFKYGIKSPYRLWRMLNRIMLSTKYMMDEHINEEPLINYTVLMAIVRECVRYRLEMKDLYILIQRIKMSKIDFYENGILTMTNATELIRTYAERKKK